MNYRFLLFVLSLCSFGPLSAQQFMQWTDDDHYILRTPQGDSVVGWKVNPQTGKRTPYSGDLLLSKADLFMRGRRPSSASTHRVAVRDNDLFVNNKRVTNDGAEEQNPLLSPDERWVAYTKNGNLFVYDVQYGRNARLTHDGSEQIYNGYASWVYFEEILGRRSRYRAYYWSPDSKYIAFLHFDDRPVPSFTIARSEGINGHTEVAHYPKPGDPNPRVKLGIVNVESQTIKWVAEDKDKDQYTAWCFWTPDSKSLLFQELNRDQDTLDLIRYDVASAKCTPLIREVQPAWVDFVEEVHFLEEGTSFLWPSRRNGWENWYRYDLNGKLLNSLGKADFDYTIEHIGDANQEIIVAGSGKQSTDRHLFLTAFDGDGLRPITETSGWNTAEISSSGNFLHVSNSSLKHPSYSYVINKSGDLLQTITAKEDAAASASVEPFSISVDGYELPGYLVLPEGFRDDRTYPVIFSVYGGPASVSVRNRYRDYSGDFMSSNGIIRVVVDHRGSGKFGKKGLDEMHRNLGTHEIDDLVEVVKWLTQKPYVDGDRIGITGGSYGGYVTAMALTYGADYFTHGVSLFPVTDWQLYDNVYTERYMDTPQSNPVGYAQGSAMTHADKLKGKLLLVHGMADDNVHAQNTMQLIAEFQKLGKPFELMVYPGKRHGWGGPERSHLTQLTEGFWLRTFGLE
ncbi:MAG: S9 family peptidase [Saprospiraceae bacterium]|nr:S9 family peptidase [Saprospiraceae bacterium]